MAQCNELQRYNAEIWYCLQDRGHGGPHFNPWIPDSAERRWDDNRAAKVRESLDFGAPGGGIADGGQP